ncbi:MAG: protein phosphatase 2C domain-containing protein [Lentisphaerae bacterium]|nr:protein phosphatase 2C domain-containing protein [Lentisphaerota bacterium]MBT5608960.1 protein phosphatase 2C domain-containing protein [Lentisphaerota bacterium]MBT7061499.1 protein phosphatase 2C domain-containing protein [Lentisphaerota bacterium]MBT7845021.1 protein phosphatase 2C domain-containing protein [Lentisphaerota bacterium]
MIPKSKARTRSALAAEQTGKGRSAGPKSWRHGDQDAVEPPSIDPLSPPDRPAIAPLPTAGRGHANDASMRHPGLCRGMAASVPGRKHIRSGTPCQDAATVACRPRPFLVVADGRGSASVSQLGAQAACAGLGDLICSAEALLEQILDAEGSAQADALWFLFSDLLFESVRTRQQAVAAKRNVSRRELEHTLLLAILGRKRLAYLHVGDGAIVVEESRGLRTLSGAERGEFANVTCFVGEKTRAEQVRTGLVPAAGITGIAAMTDGTAERLIHSRTQQPAPGIATLFQKIRDQRFARRDLLRFLTEEFWEPHVQDDRSLALLVPGKMIPNVPRGEPQDVENHATVGRRRNRHSSRVTGPAADTAPVAPALVPPVDGNRSPDAPGRRVVGRPSLAVVSAVALTSCLGLLTGWGLWEASTASSVIPDDGLPPGSTVVGETAYFPGDAHRIRRRVENGLHALPPVRILERHDGKAKGPASSQERTVPASFSNLDDHKPTPAEQITVRKGKK